jgi:protein phosphatase
MSDFFEYVVANPYVPGLGLVVVLTFVFGLVLGRSRREVSAPPPKAKVKEKAPEAIPVTAPETTEAPRTSASPDSSRNPPRIEFDEDAEVDATKIGAMAKAAVYDVLTHAIVHDEDASREEVTQPGALIVTAGFAQTDKGRHRKRNEDSLLVLEDHSVYVVADGMGGYSGGDLASSLAVTTIREAFERNTFEGNASEDLPKRASELARAIQMANAAIQQKAGGDRKLEGMGTTICAARFSPNKQRLYIGHVGDSRAYRLRNGALEQMTADHTMKDYGVVGPTAAHLSRAVGVWATVPVDILFAKPEPDDVYLLCSDGLTKMVDDAGIAAVLAASPDPTAAATALVDAANANGGKDNVTVVIVRVSSPVGPAPITVA